ncbi:UDP-N-acetylmuramoyl-tripeptide--D-alanyl-D-alanine ligase [Bacteroides sp. 214]|uniref:UDP-N-acetylmuramoyl-tripeptide--D-alanyl-D- alanine ligase n=1 Tax=Bacteroides sp. 214 TaxID=2302935 RepID=UPI0013D28E9D|nr:UDP-N-acetylmuramoyl-tripeptide--D-alanyl-D-alanine ligase [Bacteroides sp. 214]NDW12526.1 UDP-N-acetylmuramoyl-tripeptide--D-alanyl-D-alanine ligase [Bacteroides sp. 214]
MEISSLYQLFLNSAGVTTDSRNCQPNTLFFALKGESFNGNTFAEKALASGCSYAVIDEEAYLPVDDNRYVLVSDVLKTLQQLANYHRKQLGTKIIGITGTNGKTTTKELIAAVLSRKFKVLYTQGNLNNHIGVPLTLLQLKQEHDIAVVEMGASHPGDIKELVDIAEPDYGIITNVGKAHLEGFGSFEGVMATKGELYDYLRNKQNSLLFVNSDNPYLMEMSKGFNVIYYGKEGTPYVKGCVTGNSPFLALEWEATDNQKHRVETQLIGDYNFTNALAAATIGTFFGVEATEIDKALAAYTPQNNRSQLKKTAYNTLIIDAYNANPTSMMASLENFLKMQAEHKMVILGDMRELGADSVEEHTKIINYLNGANFETVLLVGDVFSSLPHTYQSFKHVDELLLRLQSDPLKGKTILIKGSNSIRLNKTLDLL